jgi:hypothetical protein
MATQIVKAAPITVDQYEAFEGFPGLRDELINGEIVLSPQPKPLYQQVSENIHRPLNKLLSGQFVAKQNSNIKLPGANSMPAPDVFVVRRADWKRACESDRYLEGPTRPCRRSGFPRQSQNQGGAKNRYLSFERSLSRVGLLSKEAAFANPSNWWDSGTIRSRNRCSTTPTARRNQSA